MYFRFMNRNWATFVIGLVGPALLLATVMVIIGHTPGSYWI
jgi:hypothetical protein